MLVRDYEYAIKLARYSNLYNYIQNNVKFLEEMKKLSDAVNPYLTDESKLILPTQKNLSNMFAHESHSIWDCLEWWHIFCKEPLTQEIKSNIKFDENLYVVSSTEAQKKYLLREIDSLCTNHFIPEYLEPMIKKMFSEIDSLKQQNKMLNEKYENLKIEKKLTTKIKNVWLKIKSFFSKIKNYIGKNAAVLALWATVLGIVVSIILDIW